MSRSTLCAVTTALCGTLAATTASSAIVELNFSLAAQQTAISTSPVGNPAVGLPKKDFGFGPQDVDPNFDEPDFYDRIYWDEYQRIMQDELGVWDPSQIPTGNREIFPSDPLYSAYRNNTITGEPFEVTSFGVISGSLVFDDSALRNVLDGVAGGEFDIEDDQGNVSGQFGQEISLQNTGSYFQVQSGGSIVEADTSVATRIIVQDDLSGLSGEFGLSGDLDIIVIQSLFDDANDQNENGRVNFLVGFDGGTFESLAPGEAPDWSTAIIGLVAADNTTIGFDGQPESVDGTPEEYELGFTFLDGAVADPNGIGLAPTVITPGDQSGVIEADPILPGAASPDAPETFNFALDASEIQPGRTFFIDPDIATGYVYTVVGSNFVSITAPTFETVGDPDGYTIVIETPGGDVTFAIASGETVNLSDVAGLEDAYVTAFRLEGIDESLGLDPENPLAFVTGVALGLTEGDDILITQTPIVVYVPDDTTPISPVPVPGSLALMLGGIAGLGVAANRRRRKAG